MNRNVLPDIITLQKLSLLGAGFGYVRIYLYEAWDAAFTVRCYGVKFS